MVAGDLDFCHRPQCAGGRMRRHTVNPAGRRLRRVLLLAGIAPAVVVLAFAVKVAAMLVNVGAGSDAFARGDYAAAAGEFSDNKTLNWFQPWVAPFDEGAAHHAAGDLPTALELYSRALRDVPPEDECTVRINEALAHEALGDRAAERGDQPTAIRHWQAGLETLSAGNCPQDAGGGDDQSEAAAAVDARLREKLEQDQEQQDQQQQQPEEQPQTPEQRQERREQERKERRLGERNDEAIEEQQDYEESDRERDYSQYHW